MVALVTLAEAKLQLRITDNDHDADVGMKVDQASDIVTDYIGAAADPTWTTETAPSLIKAAILVTVGKLYENREEAGISDQVKGILRRYRKPPLA